MSTSVTKVFDNVPDCVGYLIMNEDGSVEHSHGDLQNNEQAANLLYKMVLCATKVSVHPTKQLAFKRFTGTMPVTFNRISFNLRFSVRRSVCLLCCMCQSSYLCCQTPSRITSDRLRSFLIDVHLFLLSKFMLAPFSMLYKERQTHTHNKEQQRGSQLPIEPSLLF